MKRSNIQFLACPLCHSALELSAGDGDEHIVAGALRCTRCATTYPIERRMANLIPLQSTEVHKLREMKGWVNLWEKKGMYVNPTTFHSVSLPFIGGMWTEVARMFMLAFDALHLTGNEMVLDVGAGQGWASRYFAAKGCHVFTTDIVDDEFYGLGRAWAIMDHANVYFEPMLADGERLPFPDNQFDVVFISTALHHFVEQGPFLQQAHRVLKPGGRMMVSNEPAIPIFAREADVTDPLEEIQEGIVERRPKVYEYVRSMHEAGFVDVTVDAFETFRGAPAEIRNWQLATRAELMSTIRPRLRPLAWLAYTSLALFPGWLTGQIALHIRGGSIIMQGYKP